MIKNIVYVEDGSVDVDELQTELGEETKVIVYRQGSVCPRIEQLREPMVTIFDTELFELQRRRIDARTHFDKLFKMSKPNEVDEEIRSIYNILFNKNYNGGK